MPAVDRSGRTPVRSGDVDFVGSGVHMTDTMKQLFVGVGGYAVELCC